MSIDYLPYKQKRVFYLKHGRSGRKFNRQTIERMTAAFKGGITAVFAAACAGVFVAKTVTAFAIGITAAVICTFVAVFVAGMTGEKN